jgi:ATP sulfurylase
MQYSPYVHPVTSAGVKCVVVDVRLKDIEPMAYPFLLSFAKDNELEVRSGRGVKRPEEERPVADPA